MLKGTGLNRIDDMAIVALPCGWKHFSRASEEKSGAGGMP